MLNVKKVMGGMVGGLAVLGLSVEMASACSIHINQVAMKNDLTAEGLTRLGITLDAVTSGSLANYAHAIVDTDSQTLCPTRLTFTGDLQVTYKKNLIQTCQATLHIVKTENWADPATGVDPESYEVTGLESVSCRTILRPIRPR